MSASRPQPAPESSYTVSINEFQRDLINQCLLSALGDMALRTRLLAQPSPMGERHAFAEVGVLIELLAELPTVESESPGTLHGLDL